MIEYILGFFALLTIYNEIQFFFIKRRTRQPATILPGAEPFFYHKGSTGALLIHGFTGSPRELKELGDYLASNNITVYAPLLPGHGTAPERLAITKWYQWVEEVQESIKLLSKHCKDLYLIGNSMGGNLALLCSSHPAVKGIITLGAPIFLRHHTKSRLLLPLLKRIKIFQRKVYPKHLVTKSVEERRVTYPVIPLTSFGHLLKIIKLSKQSIPSLNKDLLVMHAKNDTVSDDKSATYIYDHAPSQKKKLKWIPPSYHVFITDKYRRQAFKTIHAFIHST